MDRGGAGSDGHGSSVPAAMSTGSERRGAKATVLVGISAWTEPTLVKAGTFYPKKPRLGRGRLRYYASRFPMVEVDSTYYAPPTERNSELWIERTPKDFVFDIKAFALLTGHPTRSDRCTRTCRPRCREELPDKQRY